MQKEDLKIGMTVTYIPSYTKKIIGGSYEGREAGKITSWNDSFVFVNYGTGNSKATRLEDLEKGDQTFYCADDSNSVLSGAFGRCETECYNCKKNRQEVNKIMMKNNTK